MYWEKRESGGESYYCFIYWDQKEKRNVRLKKEDVPQDIKTDKQAEEFCRLKESEHEAAKMRIERKLAWQQKFYSFPELLEIFEKKVKERAPNSWESQVYYLRHYGLDFFLTESQCNNLNNWPLYFERFREWLGTVKTSRSTKTETLSVASQNNVIGAVNTFLDIMRKEGKCDVLPKCEKFPRHLVNRRTAEHVISDIEAQVVTSQLIELDKTKLAPDFFQMLLGTGLRLAEGLGISLADFFPGQPTNSYLKDALARNNLKCYGYIVLESQVTSRTTFRDKKGKVLRKPLKGRKVIDGKASRLIPIIDKKVFNILARRYNEQTALFEKKKYGSDKADYLLFNGLTKSGFHNRITAAYEKTQYEPRTAHCARHTFATNFAGLTNADTGLCRLILGHKDEQTTLDYVHLFEQISRQAKANDLVRTKIDLIDDCA